MAKFLSREYILVFLSGAITGCIISSLFYGSSQVILKNYAPLQFQSETFQSSPDSEHFKTTVIRNNQLTDQNDSRNMDNGDKDIHSDKTTKTPHNEDEPSHHRDDTNLAKELFSKVKVLCFVITTPKNIKSRAIYVKNTWAKRCNKMVFMSSADDADLPAVGLNLTAPEGSYALTEKIMLAFRYVYNHYFHDYDWFLKADDDTFVIMENLRYFLSDKNVYKPVYYGQRFDMFLKNGYYSGGAGYVLSKEALRRLVVGVSRNKELCHTNWGVEDVEVGDCLSKLGVHTSDTRDSLGRTRFHCLKLEDHLRGFYPPWYAKYYKLAGRKWGADSISDYAISFHYERGRSMLDLEYFVYHLRPYGVISYNQDINMPPTR